MSNLHKDFTSLASHIGHVAKSATQIVARNAVYMLSFDEDTSVPKNAYASNTVQITDRSNSAPVLEQLTATMAVSALDDLTKYIARNTK